MSWVFSVFLGVDSSSCFSCVGLPRLPDEGQTGLSVEDEPLHHPQAAGGWDVWQRPPVQVQRDRGAGGYKEVSG